MGDIFVDIFLDTLKNLIMSSNDLDEKDKLQSVAEDIKYLRGFLKITEKKRYEHPQVMDLVMRIRDVISKTENIVELYVVFKAKHSPLEHHVHLSLDLDSLKKEIKTLKAEVEHILGDSVYDIKGVAEKKLNHPSTGSEGIGGSSLSEGRNIYKVGDEKVVVGFEDDVKTLLGKLHDSGDNGQLEIISIISTGGSGKTTLAGKVYDHPLTLQKFEIRAWVNVSHDYNQTRKKDLLISILESGFPTSKEEYTKSTVDHLGELVYKHLLGRKYLIVMDDIWDIEAWNDIQRSYPKECKGSKVLFTSRQPVQPNNVHCICHYLNLLSESYSWELLQMKVFKKEQCPPELVDIGNEIAEKCKGLPLAIVAIAGILATKDKTLDIWEEVAKHLSSIIAKNQEGIMDILELSYNHLPLHLKACFLYIGAHPKESEIRVRELIWLWIAEGFIEQIEGGESLEAVAEDCLTDLVDRNLIMVARKRSIGTVKECHIHDLLRELCVKKGMEDNFFIPHYQGDSFSLSETNKHRRLFSSTEMFSLFYKSPCADQIVRTDDVRSHNLRSYVCLKEPDVNYAERLSSFATTFPLLRVLHYCGNQCIPEIGYGDLLHLRYLAFVLLAGANYQPQSNFRYLSNLEVLNLEPWKDMIILPYHIFEMVKLRHIYSRTGIFSYHHDSYDEDEGNMLDSLQTLQRMGVCEDCLHFLERTPNLRKLRLDGSRCPKIHDYLILPNLEFLKCLEILYIQGRYDNKGVVSTGLKLPSTLKQLTLKDTRMEWEKLSTILQTLTNLEVLKLLEASCDGHVWDTSELEEGFPRLKYLRLSNLYIREWIASEDLFPRIEVIVISQCSYLKSIPIEFANLYELREVIIEFSSLYAEESAKEILEEQRITKGDDGCLNLLALGNSNQTADEMSRLLD